MNFSAAWVYILSQIFNEHIWFIAHIRFSGTVYFQRISSVINDSLFWWTIYFQRISSAINDSFMIFRDRIFSARRPYIFAYWWFIYNSYWPYILREKIFYFQRQDHIFSTFEDRIFEPTVYFQPKDRIFSGVRTVYFQPEPYIRLIRQSGRYFSRQFC